MRMVLLERGKAGTEYCRQVPAGVHLPCGSEVEQNGGSIVTDIYVVRLDIPVEEISFVYQLEPVKQRIYDGEKVVWFNGMVCRHPLFQGFARFILHHNIGCSVRLEVAKHPNDIGVAKICQGSCLFNESFKSPLE